MDIGETTFKLGIFAGDMIFGTSNTFNRYNEMYAMKQIRDAVIEEIETKNRKIKDSEQYDQIKKVLICLRYLLYANSRGEYCMYSLLERDAQLMSLIKIGEFENYDEWFEEVQVINKNIEENLDGIIPDLNNYKRNEEDFTDIRVLTDEEIIKAIREASEFAYDWFWYSDGDYEDRNIEFVDENDTYVEYSEYGFEQKYMKVVYEGVQSVDDVVDLAERYYTQEIAEQLVAYRRWYEHRNGIYMSDFTGIEGVATDCWNVIINRENNILYTITIYDYLGDDTPDEFHYKYINGHWVFDKELFYINIAQSVNENNQQDLYADIKTQINIIETWYSEDYDEVNE